MASSTVILHDEGTRRALQFALWKHASEGVGETFYEDLAREARAALTWTTGGGFPEFAEVDDEIHLLRCTLDAVEQVRIASVGERLELNIPVAALMSGLADCSVAIVANEQFWLSPSSERERQLASYDGAQRLLQDLECHAEAVA